MTIHTKSSGTAKYFVLVSNGKDLPPVLHKNPTVCSFYGIGYYSTTRKEAYELAKDLYSKHPNRIYQICCLNPSDHPSLTFGS